MGTHCSGNRSNCLQGPVWSGTCSNQPVAVGEVVAEVMGTGTLEAHYQATVRREGPGPHC